MITKRMSAMDLVHKSLSDTQDKKFQENAWGQRHSEFWHAVWRGDKGKSQATAIVRMVDGWAVYADAHFKRYESLIGDDGVLGPSWQAIGSSIIDLLNGETGELDCGTVDSLVREIARANGIESDDL